MIINGSVKETIYQEFRLASARILGSISVLYYWRREKKPCPEFVGWLKLLMDMSKGLIICNRGIFLTFEPIL